MPKIVCANFKTGTRTNRKLFAEIRNRYADKPEVVYSIFAVLDIRTLVLYVTYLILCTGFTAGLRICFGNEHRNANKQKIVLQNPKQVRGQVESCFAKSKTGTRTNRKLFVSRLPYWTFAHRFCMFQCLTCALDLRHYYEVTLCEKLISSALCYPYTNKNMASLIEQCVTTTTDKTIKIISADNCEFHLPYSQAVLCDFFKNEINDYDGDDELVFELSKCPSAVLSRISNFLAYYVVSPFDELPKPLNASLKDLLPAWYFAFLGVPENVDSDYVNLCADFLLHAHYVGCVPLVSLLSAYLSTVYKTCKSVKEVCEISGIERDIAEPTVEDVEKFKVEFPHLYSEYDPFQVLRELQEKHDGVVKNEEVKEDDVVESEEEEDD